MKCISFSLYGNETNYTIGAIKNAILASRYFPFDDGFVTRFYVGKSVDSSGKNGSIPISLHSPLVKSPMCSCSALTEA